MKKFAYTNSQYSQQPCEVWTPYYSYYTGGDTEAWSDLVTSQKSHSRLVRSWKSHSSPSPKSVHLIIVLHCSIGVWMNGRWVNKWMSELMNKWTCEGRVAPTSLPASRSLSVLGKKQPSPFRATTFLGSCSLSLSHPRAAEYKGILCNCGARQLPASRSPHPLPESCRGRQSRLDQSAGLSACWVLCCHCWVSHQAEGSCSGIETWRKMGWDQISIPSQADVPPNLQAFVILLAVKECWNGALALIWIIISEAIFKST